MSKITAGSSSRPNILGILGAAAAAPKLNPADLPAPALARVGTASAGWGRWSPPRPLRRRKSSSRSRIVVEIPEAPPSPRPLAVRVNVRMNVGTAAPGRPGAQLRDLGGQCFNRCPIATYGAGCLGPIYSARGRIKRLSSSCSMTCAPSRQFARQRKSA